MLAPDSAIPYIRDNSMPIVSSYKVFYFRWSCVFKSVTANEVVCDFVCLGPGRPAIGDGNRSVAIGRALAVQLRRHGLDRRIRRWGLIGRAVKRRSRVDYAEEDGQGIIKVGWMPGTSSYKAGKTGDGVSR